ncbi:hypothetical protein BU14_0120s0029 [Porphyra umbilicalis]|uniref:Uncharacterized protein n=1 Tax=Porphyra umbilicalis TaxID=2786 RepID=A0A1X6PBP6_PORUM|nr:hypothetical protein BU14_0120s0029 [Porphyra umbilicalis]|eukprot:OSX78145.1 hypothetical protein BU14_0120s0029 [Porphyra umbilicalis]
MDRTAGEAVVKSTRRGSVVIVEDAGHHLYWDNVGGFVQAVLQGTGLAAAGGAGERVGGWRGESAILSSRGAWALRSGGRRRRVRGDTEAMT